MGTDDVTIAQGYEDADLARAIQAYKFFYPTVSGAAIIKGNIAAGMVFNKVFGILDCGPEQLVFTANSDTPYGPLLLDLADGPLVVELPPGPLIVCSLDINQRWVADMGFPARTPATVAGICCWGRTTPARCRRRVTTCTVRVVIVRSSECDRSRSTATLRAQSSD